VHADAVQPGTRLAGRYRIEERLQDGDGTAFWRATDELLRRSVGVRTLSASSARAGALMSAARAASLISDPRFLHVLDVSEQNGRHESDGAASRRASGVVDRLSPSAERGRPRSEQEGRRDHEHGRSGTDGGDRIVYVVSEWVHGSSLGALIRSQGPLDPEEARRITREVAEALALVSPLGLAHRAVTPDCVVRTESGSVKLVGLGVDAAVAGLDGDGTDGAAVDARSVGALLYVALTGRWPDGPAFGFPAAPTEHGSLCTPRQVRAGVPADLDAIAERALTESPRQGLPLRTPAAIAAALSVDGYREGYRDPVDAHTSLLEVAPAAIDVSAAPARISWPARLTAVARVAAALLLVVGVALIAWQLAEPGLRGGGEAGDSGTAAAAPPVQKTPEVLRIVSADDFDPEGDNGEEHPREVPLAIDRDSDSAWHTQGYRQADIGNKAGVGLLLDLGAVKDVSQVTVRLAGDGTDVELRTSESGGDRSQDYRKVAAKIAATGRTELIPPDPVRARYVVLWLTRLPSDGGEFRGGVSDVQIRGTSVG
jgi:hypothetical protein